jgi:hypothetical protein
LPARSWRSQLTNEHFDTPAGLSDSALVQITDKEHVRPVDKVTGNVGRIRQFWKNMKDTRKMQQKHTDIRIESSTHTTHV